MTNVLDAFGLVGRRALVTGSSGGIGLALARAMAQAGAQVILNGRNAGKLAAATALLQAEGLLASAAAFDVTDADAKSFYESNLKEFCSVQSELGRPGTAPYMASKGALKMLTKGMAVDWGPHGLQVNGLGPGYFKTELTQSLVDDPTFSAWLVGHTPSRRWGDVEDLGPAIVFLASDASRFVNGHILYVDGGITATL